MTIYRYLPDSNNWASLESTAAVRDQFKVLFHSVVARADWQTPTLQVDFTMGEVPDFPSLIQPFPIVSHTALYRLEAEMSCSYSPLPVALSGIDSPFFLLQVPVVDCLDSANSSIRINSVSGRVSTVKEYTFSNSADLSMGLFKIPETFGLETLATDAFTKVVQEADLKGLNFKPLKIRS